MQETCGKARRGVKLDVDWMADIDRTAKISKQKDMGISGNSQHTA
jgi:hypothetical protein